MSTRANIIVKDSYGSERILYHHHDGYPEGVGWKLMQILRHITDYTDNVESLASFIIQQYAEFQLTDNIHGDIEYLYTIDTSLHELYYENYIFEEHSSQSDSIKHPLCSYQPIPGTKNASQVQKIQLYLKQLEKEHDIRILYAVESGSRAWGFASDDSDFDIRFIYVHKPEWYLRVNPCRDFIEQSIQQFKFDIVGWELRKSLSLFQKTNPSMSEWLHSPIIYTQRVDFIDVMWQLEPYFFNPIKSMHHYLSIARNHDERYLQSHGFTLKRFLYYLRSLLACIWIEQNQSMPPVDFETLINATVTSPNIKKAINELLDKKRENKNHDASAVCQELIYFTAKLYSHYTSHITTYHPRLPSHGDKVPLLDKLLYGQAIRISRE